MSDSFRIDISTEGRESLPAILQLGFTKSNKATHYQVVPADAEQRRPMRLVLFWSINQKPDSGILPLPYNLNSESAVDFAWNWLQSAEYGKQPDHDGHNQKGYRVYNENWGRVDGHFDAFLAIEPRWMMYGK